MSMANFYRPMKRKAPQGSGASHYHVRIIYATAAQKANTNGRQIINPIPCGPRLSSFMLSSDERCSTDKPCAAKEDCECDKCFCRDGEVVFHFRPPVSVDYC